MGVGGWIHYVASGLCVAATALQCFGDSSTSHGVQRSSHGAGNGWKPPAGATCSTSSGACLLAVVAALQWFMEKQHHLCGCNPPAVMRAIPLTGVSAVWSQRHNLSIAAVR